MADFSTFSGLKKQNLVIKAYSMHSVFFDTINPNYYRVHNQGNATIYCGTTHQPTTKQYNFSVRSEGVKAYAEPFAKNVLYIYNPSGSDIPVSLLTFKAEFDPIALILADLSFDFSGLVLESNSNITAFNAALPTGNNKIGKVEVTNTQNYTNVLNYIENHLATLKANQRDYTEKLAEIELNQQDYNGVLADIEANQKDYSQALTEIKAAIEGIAISGGGGGDMFYSSAEMYSAVDHSSATEISVAGENTVVHFLTNDGSGNMTLYLGGIPFTIKPGEIIQDFKFNNSISVNGTNYSFRAMVSKVGGTE